MARTFIKRRDSGRGVSAKRNVVGRRDGRRDGAPSRCSRYDGWSEVTAGRRDGGRDRGFFCRIPPGVRLGVTADADELPLYRCPLVIAVLTGLS